MISKKASSLLRWAFSFFLAACFPTGDLKAASEKSGKAGYRSYNIDFESDFGKAKNRDVYIWYPTTDEPKAVGRGWKKGFVAKNGRVSPGKYPLILFSHGYRASGHQVLYLMEALARAGYIVVSTDHSDAFRRMLHERGSCLPFLFRGNLWKDIGVQSRREDVLAMLDFVLSMDEDGAFLDGRIDHERIGIIGYSLGGYTSLAMLGAVPHWKDERFKAAVFLAPFFPWSGGQLREIDVPTMVQAGSWDIFVTPKVGSLYRSLPAPSELLLFKRATHFTWTNLASLGKDTVTVVKEEENPKMIVEYAIAFFDQTLKCSQRKSDILRAPNPKLKKYLWK